MTILEAPIVSEEEATAGYPRPDSGDQTTGKLVGGSVRLP